VTVG